jgi:tRNA threonylcarbamoyladenosine biosynthesis protein TsaB
VRVLALDTATRATSVAVCEIEQGAPELPTRGKPRELRDDPPAGSRPGHSQRLLALVAQLLEEAGLGWDGIDRLAVGVGPGTFTGLRIGIAVAQGLALARSLPLVGVSSLRSLALGAQPAALAAGAEQVCAVLDARRREVFAARWPAGAAPALEPVAGPAALSPAGLGEELAAAGACVLAVGDGAIEFRAALERGGAIVPAERSEIHRVSAVHHCRLAAGAAVARGAVLPDYVRPPDAELSRRPVQ